MTIIRFIQAKGGQGCSTVAAITALSLSQTVPTLIVGGEDMPALLGASVPMDGYAPVTDRLELVIEPGGLSNHGQIDEYDHVVIDNVDVLLANSTYLVTKCCYLALSAAVRLRQHYDGIVVLEEPARALTPYDVARALSQPVVATVPWDPAVARSIDAGLLTSHVPTSASRALGPLVRDHTHTGR